MGRRLFCLQAGLGFCQDSLMRGQARKRYSLWWAPKRPANKNNAPQGAQFHNRSRRQPAHQPRLLSQIIGAR